MAPATPQMFRGFSRSQESYVAGRATSQAVLCCAVLCDADADATANHFSTTWPIGRRASRCDLGVPTTVELIHWVPWRVSHRSYPRHCRLDRVRHIIELGTRQDSPSDRSSNQHSSNTGVDPAMKIPQRPKRFIVIPPESSGGAAPTGLQTARLLSFGARPMAGVAAKRVGAKAAARAGRKTA